jgi:hypothetical protein
MGTVFNAPPNAPTGVRSGETMAALFMISFTGSPFQA